MLVRCAIVAFFACLCVNVGLAADTKTGKAEQKALQGQPWAFGVSESRKDALWQQSVKAHEMHDKATPDTPAQPGTDSVDTTKGIDSALQGQQKRRGKKDELGVSWEREKQGWHSGAKALHTPDEHLPVDSRHHVRAFADVEAGDNLNINVGPELIVKDNQKSPYTGKSEQPDSSVGMGMQFQLGF